MVSTELIILIILNCLLTFVFSDDIIVQLPNGKIRGRVTTTVRKTTFYAFQEIPYAAPPTGSLRFKAPSPVQDWDEILNTTQNTKICIQTSTSTDAKQNEDCLYLNVFTPVVPNSDERLPVLMFIHGGSFLTGSGLNSPHYFMDTKRIVVVTINYRLGPFGYLSTQDKVIPGNNGLKDQWFALKWIQENIYLFGGDPSKVTINGQSAGSASVSYLVLSKKSQGLFRAAIMESGTVLTPWSYQRYARNIAYQMAAALDSSFTEDKSSEELLEFLQKASAKDLQSISVHNLTVPTKHINSGFIFAPVLETGDAAFLTEYSYEALEKGELNQVPLIVGMNSEECISSASNLNSLKKLAKTYDEDITIVVNDDFHIQNETVQTEVGEAVRKIFTDGLFEDDLGALIRFCSDSRYTTNIIKYGQIVSAFTNVYFYQFSYGGTKLIDGAETVGHSAELTYLWGNQDMSKLSDGFVLTHQRLVQMWTNFVTDLNPIPESIDLFDNITWPSVVPDNHKYLYIGDEMEVKKDPKGDGFKAMDSIYQNYGVRPFETY